MVNYHQEFLQYQYCMYLYKTNVLMGILYTISYKLMYLFFIVSITIYIVHHSNSTGLLNYLIYSSMILPMIGWYAPLKLLLKLCMYFILIITCNLISHIMIISNCFYPYSYICQIAFMYYVYTSIYNYSINNYYNKCVYNHPTWKYFCTISITYFL